MKLAFFWTWEFSKNIMKWILDIGNDIDICLVVSQPDKPSWRDKKVIETPIKKFAIENNIEVLQPVKLKPSPLTPLPEGEENLVKKLKSLNLDFIIVVAYGKIIPKEILEIPKYGCINIHWSILPKYRWASPIQESLKNWDKWTWLTIMYMSEGMDEWDVLKIEEIGVDNVDKTIDIFNKFEKIWPKLLLDTLSWIITWKIKWIPQDNSKATYCKKIEKEDWLVDFKKETSFKIYNKFRAYYNWPGIYTYFDGKKLNLEEISIAENVSESGQIWQVIKLENKKIWVICKDNKAIIIEKVKLEWKKSISTRDFINGNKSFVSVIL
jgi:methionyl-tRNA formyltransferase